MSLWGLVSDPGVVDEEDLIDLKEDLLCEGPHPESHYGHTVSGRKLRYQKMLPEKRKLNRNNPYNKITHNNTLQNKRDGCMLNDPHTDSAPTPHWQGEGDLDVDEGRERWVS